jgi:20S proteasome subunit alpha 6
LLLSPLFPPQNVSIGIVGKDLEFTIYDDDDVSPFLEGLEERPQRKAQVYN